MQRRIERGTKQLSRHLLTRKSAAALDARRIQVDLADLNMTPDIKTIRNSMIRQGLVPKAARKFKVTTNRRLSAQCDRTINLVDGQIIDND